MKDNSSRERYAPLILNVNHQEYTVRVAPDAPLLWVIREDLGLTGTKFGCGEGICGACTVLQDDEPVRACLTPVADAVGSEIVTIEGLSARGRHPVQQAWIDEEVPQCGYCQSGQILAAAALLAQNPTPDDEAIDDAMSDNLCRCGTYQRIRRAVHLAAQIMAQGGKA